MYGRAAKFFFSVFIYFVLLPQIFASGPRSTFVSAAGKELVVLNAIDNLPGDSTRVTFLIKVCIDSAGSNIAYAEAAAREALALAERLQYDRGIIESNLALADIWRITANFTEADKSIQLAVSLSTRLDDEIALAKCNLGMYKLLFARGDYAKAADYNRRALATGEQTSNQEILADAYGNEGVISGINGEHIKAIEHFLKAREIYNALNNELMVGLALMRIGHTFELAGSYNKALDYLNQSLEVNVKFKHWSNAGWCLLNIGVTYSRIYPADYALKDDYYQRALVMAERSNDLRLKLACLDNIGGNYSMRGDYKNANAWLSKAYKLSTSAGHNSRTVFIAGNLAENYLYTGQLDSAVLFGEENLRIAIQENNTFEKRQAYSVLSQIYAARNESKKAYEMLLRHTHLTDSIFNVQKSEQIEELREKYESEKREQQIELLTKEKAAEVFRRNMYGLLALLFLAVGFLVFLVLRMRVRKKQLLLDREIDLDRMKSRFFANISHEFRTPLTLILGPIDDMLSRVENAGIEKHLRPMRKNAGRLLELVNQLLELSRIESGKSRPALTKNNIVALARGIAMSFDSLAEMKNIGLEVLTGAEPIEMFIDRDKFEKIMANLLSNAFKFTPQDGRISVTVRQSDESRVPGSSECLEIAVKDSGQGIPPEEIVHIFDRFYQADNNQLYQHEGSGIGLALTKELVELHRGVIWAEQDMTTGSEIRIHLPMNLDEILKDCIVGEAEPRVENLLIRSKEVHDSDFVESDEGPDDSEKPIVLVIEDHVDVRNYIRDTLRKSYLVLEASDGIEGIAAALERIPDLILCDVMMPKMSGNQVCVRLKHEEKTSHIPIILLTAKADIESRIEGLETKADGYLTKPFVPKELLLRIGNLIESREKLRKKYVQALTLKPHDVVVTSVDEKFLRRMMDFLERHMGDETFGVEALSSEIGMSRSQLHRKLKALTGQGPNQFIRSFRLNRAHDLLKVNAGTAAEIAYTVGFSSPSYFTKCFHEQFGYTPSEIEN